MKYYLLLIPFIFLSCKSTKNMKNEKPDIGSIMYEYQASSVAPQYHRSYVLLVSPDKIKVTVDSYGTILTDTAIAISKNQFSEIVALYDSLCFKSVPKKDNKGCVGGTGAVVKTWDVSDTLIFDGYISFCGGQEFGNMEGDVKKLSEKIRSFIPDFEALLKRDWKPEGSDE
ncbi:hypothetical protein DSECCO2_516690 [anaerobic digester metagenome]